MPTSMGKPLDGAGLAIVNQIFNERLSEMGEGSGGIDWGNTPYTTMNLINNSQVFCSVILCTELRSSTICSVRIMVIAYVKQESYTGSQQILLTLPGDFPTLTFEAVSGSIPQMTGTGTLDVEMTGTGSKVSLRINPQKVAVANGFYSGSVASTVIV